MVPIEILTPHTNSTSMHTKDLSCTVLAQRTAFVGNLKHRHRTHCFIFRRNYLPLRDDRRRFVRHKVRRS